MPNCLALLPLTRLAAAWCLGRQSPPRCLEPPRGCQHLFCAFGLFLAAGLVVVGLGLLWHLALLRRTIAFCWLLFCDFLLLRTSVRLLLPSPFLNLVRCLSLTLMEDLIAFIVGLVCAMNCWPVDLDC